MPTLSSSNRSQLSFKLEGTYPTNWGVVQAGNGTNLRMTGESLDFTIKTEQSKEIRADRQITDIVQTGASAQGGFQYEMSYREFDAVGLEGVMQNTFTEYGVAGLSADLGDLDLTATTITADAAPLGANAFTNLQKGQWFAFIPPAGASSAVKAYFKSRAFRVSLVTAPTATVITLDAITPINTTIAGTTLTGGQIGTSRMTNGSTMKSYTLQVSHEDVAQYRVYRGMIPSKMDFKLASGSIITGSIDFMGKDMLLQGTSEMGTAVESKTFDVANAIKGVFDLFEAAGSVTASTFIKSLDFSIDNTLRAQEAVGVYGNAGVASGQFKVQGKLEVYFADEVFYNKFLNNEVSSLSVPVLDNEGNGYVFYIPKMKYSAAKVNSGGLDQDNMLSVDFYGLMDSTSVSPTYQKTLAIYRVGV